MLAIALCGANLSRHDPQFMSDGGKCDNQLLARSQNAWSRLEPASTQTTMRSVRPAVRCGCPASLSDASRDDDIRDHVADESHDEGQQQSVRDSQHDQHRGGGKNRQHDLAG